MIPTLGLWLSVIRGGQVAATIDSLLTDKKVRTAISKEITKNIIEGNQGQDRARLEAKQSELTSAISNQLSQDSTRANLKNIAGNIFDGVTTGARTVSIDPTQIVDDLVTAINSVPGLPKISRDKIGDIKPVVLGKDKPLPDLSPIRNGITLVAIITFVLSLLFSFAIFRLSGTPYRGTSIPLIFLGTIWSGILFAGIQFVKGKLESGIQADVVPFAAGHVLSGVRLVAGCIALLGIVLLVAHFKSPRKISLEGAPA